MKKTVLLYNFSEEELPRVKRALLPLKAAVKVPAQEEYDLPVGFLAGLTVEGEPKPSAPGPGGRLLVMGGFLSSDIDRLLAAMRKAGFSREVLKAVITPSNSQWSGPELYAEIKREHDAMTGKK